VLRDVLLGAGDRQPTRRFDDRAGVLENVPDCCACLVGMHRDDLVNEFLAEAKGLVTHAPHRDAIGEDANVFECNRRARCQRLAHRIGVVRLHAHDADRRPHLLDPGGYARDQAATADGHEQHIDIFFGLFENFLADRALAGDHDGIVERVYEYEALFVREFAGVPVRVVIRIAVQDHFAAERRDGFGLDGRRSYGHDDDRANAAAAGRESDALRVIARGTADDAVAEFALIEVRDLVVGAAQLEREDRLQVFPFHQDAIADAPREVPGVFERRHVRNIVDARVADQVKVIGRHHVALIAYRRGVRKTPRPGDWLRW
jgi:hypothetical protein